MRVIVLDLDDTLFPEHDYVRSGFEAVDHLIRLSFGSTGFLQHAWSFFIAGYRRKIFDAALERMHLPVERNVISGMVAVYRSHIPCISLFSDAESFLDRHFCKYPLCILSDGALSSQFHKYNALNLDRWCEAQVFTDLFGKDTWKPAAEGYQKVESKFPQATHFTYIADNPIKDFITARRRGWSTIRIRRKGCQHYGFIADIDYDAHHTVHTFDEVDLLL
jgi:putative hydrolase of the HAD superfamily